MALDSADARIKDEPGRGNFVVEERCAAVQFQQVRINGLGPQLRKSFQGDDSYNSSNYNVLVMFGERDQCDGYTVYSTRSEHLGISWPMHSNCCSFSQMLSRLIYLTSCCAYSG